MVEVDLEKLSEAELVELNHAIVERLQFLSRVRTQSQMLKFRVGEQVCFQPEGHPVLRGMVVRCNTRTITVVTPQGQRWNVSPRLLSKVVEGGAESVDASNVIELRTKEQT